MNINTWNSYQEEISKLKAFLNEKYMECRTRERESEEAYQVVKAYSNLEQNSLKEFLQDAADYSNKSEVNLPEGYVQRGVYLNYKFADRRRMEGNELAARGTEDEISGFTSIYNYIEDNFIAESINWDKVGVEFVGPPGKTKEMKITNIEFAPSHDLQSSLKQVVEKNLTKAGKHLKGTSRIDKLKSIKKITPSLEVFDLGATEMTLTDIMVSIGFNFYHGKDKTSGKVIDVPIQNKTTVKYKDKPFMIAIKSKNARNLKEVIKYSFGEVVFFRINGVVYYTSEILVQFGKELIKCIENNDEKGFYDLIGGK